MDPAGRRAGHSARVFTVAACAVVDDHHPRLRIHPTHTASRTSDATCCVASRAAGIPRPQSCNISPGSRTGSSAVSSSLKLGPSLGSPRAVPIAFASRDLPLLMEQFLFARSRRRCRTSVICFGSFHTEARPWLSTQWRLSEPRHLLGLTLTAIPLLVAGLGPLTAEPSTRGPAFTQGENWLLGTDSEGRDVATQLLLGGHSLVLVAIGAVVVAYLIAVPWGVAAATAQRRVFDELLMRPLDLLLSLPSMMLLVAALTDARTRWSWW